jgi:glycosyltransferase involved in cell wall biosynthesis
MGNRRRGAAMNILFASGAPYLPQILGGVNTNTHEWALHLRGEGHEVAVLARLAYRNLFGLNAALRLALSRRQWCCDTRYGYPVFRARHPWLVAGQIPRPDVVVIQDGYMQLPMAEAFARLGVPTVCYLHGLGFEDWAIDGRPAEMEQLPMRSYCANSRFTAERFRARYRQSAAVIPPVFRSERYRVESRKRNITFINPVAEKGVDLALEIAALCPEIPFRFVKGWPLSPRAFARLSIRIGRLPNVTLRERTIDMREVYRDARILLVPSQWEAETWGRVVSEGHFSGIPAVASDRGGLPEAVGEGGVIIGAGEPAERWACALRRLWNDADYYDEKARAALAYSQRPELDIRGQAALLIAVLQEAAHLRQSAPRRAVA